MTQPRSAVQAAGGTRNVLAPAAARRDEQRDFLLTERDFDKIRALIHRRAGISLGSQKREMVYSRLARRLRALQLVDFATYLEQLESDDRSPSGSCSSTR